MCFVDELQKLAKRMRSEAEDRRLPTQLSDYYAKYDLFLEGSYPSIHFRQSKYNSEIRNPFICIITKKKEKKKIGT